MKTKSITVSSADINTQTQKVYNCGITLTSTGQYDTPAGPKSIYFSNASGANVEFNFITSEEYPEFIANSANFKGVLVKTGESYKQSDYIGRVSLEPQPSYLLVKGLSGGATAAITIYCLDYS
jgi:hypothetical protein